MPSDEHLSKGCAFEPKSALVAGNLAWQTLKHTQCGQWLYGISAFLMFDMVMNQAEAIRERFTLAVFLLLKVSKNFRGQRSRKRLGNGLTN